MYKKPPGNPLIFELAKSCKERSIHLGAIKVVIEEVDGQKVRKCAWCGQGKLRTKSQRYCSPDCATSCMAFGYPQKEDALGLLLVSQEWKCKLCSYDYRPLMQSLIDADKRRYGSVDGADLTKLPWWYIKRLKNRVPSDRRPEVDHIVPIYKGGQALGLENHQAICYTCHKAKTSIDLSGKRAKKE